MSLKFLKIFICFLSLLFWSGGVWAQSGEDNPTGVAGQFNGDVTTAGSYDPYTGNATRTVTDLVVPGGVGGYPLSFTRTINTRANFASLVSPAEFPFGKAGAWRHNYQWEIKSEFFTSVYPCTEFAPSKYVVTYPDGRLVTFVYDSVNLQSWHSNTVGIADRFLPVTDFVPIDSTHDRGTCYLLLADGGMVAFQVIETHPLRVQCEAPSEDPETGYSTGFAYSCTGITDPYGQSLTITRSGYDVQSISEPGGRSLKLYYKTFNGDRVIDYVEERFDASHLGRTVTYGYAVFGGTTALDSVTYFGASSPGAHYTYQTSNGGGTNPPLIATCDDSMFNGPMSKISYQFLSGGAHGQLQAEKHINGTAVSTLSVTGANTRQETRGDGKTRTFTYSGGLLKSWTDFKAVSSSQNQTNGFVTSFTDANSNTTTFQRNAINGNVQKITHPGTPSETDHLPAGETPPAQPFASRAYSGADPNNNDPNDPYYLYSATDERSFSTIFLRDTAKRVKQINYPDSSYETFSYDDLSHGFGQMEVHRRKNGYYEHFEYDSRGLLIHAWNPVVSASRPTGSEAKTTIAYYPLGDAWQDRVKSVTDPRDKITTYEYESSGSTHIKGRGLITKIVYPGGKYRTFAYDRVGNLTRGENELRQPMEYVYDDYNRVTQAKTAHPSATNPAVQDGWMTVTYDYTPAIGVPTYSRTASLPTTVTSATGVVTTNEYDENLRLWKSHRDPGGINATTEFHYDAAGNQDYVIDPNIHKTTFAHDQRNRRSKATSPAVDVAGVVGKVALVTEWYYDPVGNVRLVIQPDSTTTVPREQVSTFDSLNRVLTSKDPMGRVTTYTYFPSGMLKSVKDPKLQVTQFEYDERDLRKKLTYPNSVAVTGWEYDDNGNMTTRPTVGGPKQLFTYDDRNRPMTMRWDNAIDYSDFGYDDAGRLASANNPFSTITRQYDVAGRLILDRQKFPAVPNALPAPVQPLKVVSRRAHGAAGTFDITLPLTGTPGVECRSGGATGDYTLVLTFANAVTVGNVTMSSGTGRVVNAHPAGGTTITVNLTDVSDAQRLTVTLSGLSNGSSTGDLVVPMQVLVGDVTGNGSVNATDVNSVSAFSGQPLAQTNFRNDVNVSGSINATDVAVVQAASGGVLPAAGPSDLTADVSYGYDNDGKTNRLSVGGTDYDFSFGYDGMGRFETISLNPYGGYQYQYYYDKASNVLERRNNLTLTSQFSVPDELNRLKERIMEAKRFPAGQPAELYNFSYEKYGYDKMSRLSTVTRVEDGRRDVYGYNAAGELTSANYGLVLSGGVYVNPLRQVTYGLDNAGNRTGVTDTVNGGTAFMPNNLNQYTQTGNGTQHEVTAYTNGIETVSYAYLGDGPLAAVSSASQGNYALGYDALGRCVRRKTNGQTTYYAFAGGGAILELDAATTGLQQAILGNTLFGLGPDEIIARNNGGTPQFFMQDWQGSTRAVTDITGKLLEQYRYDAFGAPTIKNPSGALLSTSMINNRFLFTGREWVQRYGFYEYRARAYHPKLGRFMSEDPLGFAAGDINLFRYTGNDPVNRTDPTGLVTSDSDKEDDDIQPGAPATSYTNGWGEYRPTGSNIPRSATATSNGNGLDISFHDAVNGTHELGSFGFVNGDLVSAPSGVNSDGTPILRAGAVNQGGAGIGDFIGKIWALPNTILGTVIGLASLPFGGHFLPPANNAIQISLPWGDRPLTLGNVQLYGGNTVPSQETSRYDEGPGAVVYGSHEEAHTYQYQVLGPLFLPIYLLSGGIHSQPFENAADNYAQGIGSWWPGQ